MPMAAQLAHAVLHGLGLQLVGGGDVGHQRQVYEDGVLAAHVLAELADGLQEGQALDVAHGAADLHDHHVRRPCRRPDGGLDLVGDVGDHLDRPAQVVAAPFLGDDRAVDLAGGDVGGLAT